MFDSAVDLASEIGAQVHRLVRSVIEDIEKDGAVIALPNNYSEELISGREGAVAPLSRSPFPTS